MMSHLQGETQEVVPEVLDADKAITMMLAEPLLIRRPLIKAEGRREVDFDLEVIAAWA